MTDFRGRIFAAPRSGRHRPWRGAAKLVGFALALASARGVLADPGSSPGPGVRFVASLSAPPLDAAGAEYADLRVEQTISAHAGEVDFYGPVQVDLGAFAARDGAPERIIWSETGRHRDRGPPNVRFRRIAGTARLDQRALPIDSAPRTIGLRLPSDELIVASSLLAGALSAAGPDYVLGAHTRLSGVKVAVRLRRILCAR